MKALNDEYFAQEEFKRIAGGEDPPGWVHRKDGPDEETDWRQGEGGILNPTRHPIKTGITLVRFGAFKDGAPNDPDDPNRRTPETNADPSKRGTNERTSGPMYFGKYVAVGAWWMDWTAYKKIEIYADKIGESVAYAVRQVCAVPKEWSDMSYVIQGTTRSPLLAWAGKGKVVNGPSGKIDPLAKGKPVIDQLYIPGLSDPDLNKKAIIVHSHAPLDPDMSEKGARRKAQQRAAMDARLRAAVKAR